MDRINDNNVNGMQVTITECLDISIVSSSTVSVQDEKA